MSDTAEQRRARRRWLTLAELVGVAGLMIAALSLWSSRADRRLDRQERAAEKTEAARAKAAVLLDGAVADGGRVLRLSDADHKIASVDIRFPAALGAEARPGLIEPRVEADWIAAPLLALAKGDGARAGRVPVLITADWWDADTHRRDRAIYDVAWRAEGRFLRGRALRLDGLALRERGGGAARLEAIWAREKPAG